jgi:hypothetical protein
MKEREEERRRLFAQNGRPSAMQSTKLYSILRRILLLGLIGIPSSTSAGTYALHGPEMYQRGTGSLVTVTHTFTVPNPDATYTLRIYNGGLVDDDSPYELVSSSTILLNGTQVVGPAEFNQNVSQIEEPVTLGASNDLAVEVLTSRYRLQPRTGQWGYFCC